MLRRLAMFSLVAAVACGGKPQDAQRSAAQSSRAAATVEAGPAAPVTPIDAGPASRRDCEDAADRFFELADKRLEGAIMLAEEEQDPDAEAVAKKKRAEPVGPERERFVAACVGDAWPADVVACLEVMDASLEEACYQGIVAMPQWAKFVADHPDWRTPRFEKLATTMC